MFWPRKKALWPDWRRSSVCLPCFSNRPAFSLFFLSLLSASASPLLVSYSPKPYPSSPWTISSPITSITSPMNLIPLLTLSALIAVYFKKMTAISPTRGFTCFPTGTYLHSSPNQSSLFALWFYLFIFFPIFGDFFFCTISNWNPRFFTCIRIWLKFFCLFIWFGIKVVDWCRNWSWSCRRCSIHSVFELWFWVWNFAPSEEGREPWED